MSVRNDVIQGIVDLMATGIAGANATGIAVQSVTRDRVNVLSAPAGSFPLVFVRDTGVEDTIARGADGTRYRAIIECRCMVLSTDPDAAVADLNDVVGAIKQFVETTTGWHPRCLAVGFSAVESYRLDGNFVNYQGACEAIVTLVAMYYRLTGEA